MGSSYGASAFDAATPGVSGRMGEQGGLRTGWLAAFGTEGYEGEPPLLEELGINFGHIRTKVSAVVLGPDFTEPMLTSNEIDAHSPQPVRQDRSASDG